MNSTTNHVKVEFLYLPAINYTMQQNRVSLIRLLTIENTGEEALQDVKAELSFEPEFAGTCCQFIDSIPAGGKILADGLRPQLQTSFFAHITERMAGSITVEVLSKNLSIFRQTYPLDILAFDQWGGVSVLPEMLSAFVTPNNPIVAPILKRASEILNKWTGSPALDEYQSRNPDRVRKQMAAIYSSITEQEVAYCSAPASFEEHGQRIRLVDNALSQKLGNCLDMSLLYASCLEAAGIHPLIVVIHGHAFAGGWLVPETFPDSTIDDSSLISKRTADGINEIVLVESTCMNEGSNTDFDDAVASADSKLVDTNRFILALDVKRSRFAGIRPLPQRILNGNQWEIKEEVLTNQKTDVIVPQSVSPYDLSGINSAIEVTKQLLWERKLLDLSLRNNLLNIRITKNTLQLISANLDRFEDALADGNEFRIMPKPNDWDNPLYNYGLYSKLETADPVIDLIKSELTQKRLRSYLSELDLGRALQHLYRSSHLSIEENGANTLYLALGLLKWFETPTSERPRYAPILLLPVEIIRKSAAKGYVIRSREEEAMMNITLLEMLRQNFGITISGLDPLPMDESGVDVKLIYSIIRNGIKNQPRWDVEEQAILGIFSFNKFIMWNDIHNNADKLKNNKVVASLVSGRLEWEATETTADAGELDKQFSPADIVLPISADSSQLEAIYEAINDKTYVLHGPPGTGKSQTITNIIANALYRGKRVLFVAEKMAALSVVQNRLQSIGLAPFCLELHSNKTKKSAVLEQLRITSESMRRSSPEGFAQQAVKLHSFREELNVYIEALHKKYPFGFSMYEAITNYLSIQGDEMLAMSQSLIEQVTKDQIAEWDDAVGELAAVGNACGHPYEHPLSGINIADYSASIKEQVAEIISRSIDVLNDIRAGLENFYALTGAASSCKNRQQADSVLEIIRILMRIPDLTPALLRQERIGEVLEGVRFAIAHGHERDRLRKELQDGYADSIFAVDAAQLLALWKQHAGQWFLPRYLGQNKIRKQLAPYSHSGALKSSDVAGLLMKIIKFQEENKIVLDNSVQISDLYGNVGKREEWDTIDKITNEFREFNNLILDFSGDISVAAKIKEALAVKMVDGIETFKSIYGRNLVLLDEAISNLAECEKRMFSLLGVSETIFYKHSWLEDSLNLSDQWSKNLHKLKDWYQWLIICRRLDNLNIGFVAEEYKAKNIPTEEIQNVFRKSLYRACALYIVANESKLELFKGKLFEEVIRKYKDLAANFQELTKKELYAKLAANIPSFTKEAAQSSEVGILQRNIRNNGRGISIRKLFDQIPNLLPRMCPCMLMSPMSVAQYIDPDTEKFDLIVFDEASQMPTYEAVGAIARGNNVVIVGDPHQMPPTNFFSTNTVDEDNIEIEDMESILDDCLALSMPSKYLLWHYRSKHESLIAFSNSEYYENKLLTFPSPDNIESKVSLVRIEGFYDKGKSRQNKAEAQAVVAEISKRLSDENLRKRSIGVVTFSSVQQTLIEDLLSELFVKRPDLEALALECEEPLFIKNLENVQGDERDVILFSVGYGPDAEGKVSMNFGPLNRQGGERRLNVAVSRARYEMAIYSTLRSDQIDLNRSSAVGVAGLKRFLEYAEKRENIVSLKFNDKYSGSLADIIARELVARGYQAHTNIGCSGYRIDVGIVDKRQPSNYILGILCDGENYRRAKTARDREIVQNGVLKMLGWNICRVWTMDWWEKPEEVLATIEEYVKAAEQGDVDTQKQTGQLSDNQFLQTAASSEVVSDEQPEEISETVVSIDAPCNNSREYTQAALPLAWSTSEDFIQPAYQAYVMEQIAEVINVEAPISRQLLCKRVLSAWGIARLGQRLDAHFELLFRHMSLYTTIHDRAKFFWKSKEQMEDYSTFRPVSGRDAMDLPPEEIANGIKQVLEEQISLPTPDLAKLTGQLFNYARMGTNVEIAMHKGIKVAAKKGYIKVENGRAKIM